MFPLAATEIPAPPPGYAWTLQPQLSDEFNGPLDPGKWSTTHPYYAGRPPSLFVPQNVFVRDGAVHLCTTNLDPPANGRTMAAAALASTAAIAGPGYYEARMRASSLPVASSFWLQSPDPKIEIDVQEAFGAEISPRRPYQLRSTLHWFPRGWNSNVQRPIVVTMTRPVTRWHVYGAWWRDAHNVWIYLDGKKVAEIATPAPFTAPMYLFFDTEPFETARKATPAELADSRRNTMSVDWVRSYRLTPTPPTRQGR